MDGWIKIHRQITKWQWYKNPSVRIVFEHLILIANYQDNMWNDILVKKGQVITSVSSISRDTGLSLQQVRTAVLKLKSTHDITIKTTNKYSLITIANYEKYQMGEENQQANQQALQQSNNKQITTNKNNKNIYIYILNKYKREAQKNFYGKMRFLRELREDEKYKQLTEEQQHFIKQKIMAS